MPNPANDIRKGIYSLLTDAQNTAFLALISKTVSGKTYKKVYFGQAPQLLEDGKTAVDPPFVTFNVLPISPDYDSAGLMFSFWVEFFVASFSLEEVETLAGLVSDILEGSEGRLTVGSYHVVEVRRQPQINSPLSEDVYSITVQYSVIIHG